MANFLENAFAELGRAADGIVLREVRGESFTSVTGKQLLELVGDARAYLRQSGLRPGDRCALLGPNSIQWAAIDLALMAEGIIVVPLYPRQAPAELALMMRDSSPRLLAAGDAALAEGIAQAWPDAPPHALFSQILKKNSHSISTAPNPRKDDELVTIIYTSGTSGDAKGVCLNTANLNYMLGCTTGRLNQLMGSTHEPDQVFHYLPFNFAGSWILLLSCFSRCSTLTLSTDLNRLADEIRIAAPHYFMNVPTLLERVRRGVEEAISKRDALIQSIYRHAHAAWERQNDGEAHGMDAFWLFLGKKLLFRKIRERFGDGLRALICGSAPLAPETQKFFHMLGIPVLQVYGLTETTGICTMDDPCIAPEPGRVGETIPGSQMTVGDNEEILVRGPNIFPGYWNRPQETAKVLKDGLFHTGDQGEANSRGNWRISGRIKNLIVLNSGHNIAPEPIEEKIAQHLAGAQQTVVVGNGRGYLCALIVGNVDSKSVQAALDTVNSELPHYRQIRSFGIVHQVLTPESGLLTAMGKIKRDAINKHFQSEIEQMYRKQSAATGANA